jgi:probable rRNA maturation factor
MPVLVTTRDCRVPALEGRVARSGRRLLDALGRDEAELSVLLVSDRVMRQLNRDWRGRDRTTDVLSFAQHEGPDAAPRGLLGDVVIAVPTAKRQAAATGETLAGAVERLLIHGILHLLGYDHERSEAEARRMQRRERRLAGVLGA